MAESHHDETLETLRAALAGQYTLERLLGAGAMGKVFLGRDVTLDRPVAIKVINPELAVATTFRERFLLEARTVANLRHPNIVAVYAAGETGGYLYFVMELVGGESLRQVLDRGQRYEPDRAAAILHDVAGALAYAHTQGVVHRDVKPENILIDERTGRAMLTDFGIARAASSGDGGRLTGTGLVVGSPRYMSPEQAMGEQAIDGRSDIYSLGLVGYEMLVGETPFAGTSPTALIAKHLTEPAPPVATRAPATPPGLAVAIDRALEKEPRNRWPDAAMMARAIQGDVASASLPPAPGAHTHADTRPGRRRWPLLATVAAVAVALVAWGLASRASADDTGDAYLVLPFGILRGDQSLDWLRQGSVDMLTRNLAQWRDVAVIDYERTLDLLRQANLETAESIGLTEARQLARRAHAGTVVLGQIQRSGDSLSVVARVYDVDDGAMKQEIPVSALASRDARWLFDRLASDLLGLAGAPPGRKAQVARITTSSVEAYREYLNGAHALHAWDLEAADSAFDRATTIDTTFALAYYKRALTQGWRRAADTLARHYARLAAANSARLPTRERGLVEGLLDVEEGNHGRAQQRFGALLAQDSTDAEAWYGYGDAYFHAKPQGPEDIAMRFTRALHAFDRAIRLDSSFHLAYAHRIEIHQRVTAPNFPWIIDGDTVRYLSEEVTRRLGRERIEQARARSKELAIETALQWVSADPAAAPAYERLADSYAAARRFGDAVAALERAMRQPSSRFADFPYRIAAFRLPAQPAQALATLRQAMKIYGADSLAARGSASRFTALLAAANVAMATGALDDLDRLFSIATAVDPMLPGTLRAGRPAPTTMATDPIRMGVRAAAGIAVPRERVAVDSTIASLEALPEPAGPAARKESWPLAYAAYLVSGDAKYIDVIRRWSGREPSPVIQALAALAAGDTAKAAQIASRFPAADSVPMTSLPNDFDDPLARAEVLAAVGQRRLALATLETIEPARFEVLAIDPRWAMYPRSLLDRGALYEREGDRTRAIASYERFLTLMREADPAFQPQLQLARARVNALRDAPRP